MKISRRIWLLTAAIAVLLTGVGISYAWFAQNAAMATLMEILPPDSITIIPISEKDGAGMNELDLDFREDMDTKDEDGTIHIRRPVCIKSTSPIHRLEVVHTTNLNRLNFKIYPAVKSQAGANIKFTYDQSKPISGKYKNQDSSNTSERWAKQEVLNNYENASDVADVHAYPLYWLADNSAMTGHVQVGWNEVTSEVTTEYDPVKKADQTYYFTYYYLEISWLEDTKETDLLYVMAQNVAVEGSTP